MIKAGDLFNLNKPAAETLLALVVEVWDFQRYCSEADNACLEIDIDDAWKNWESRGPLLVVLHPVRKELCKVWSNHGQSN